MPDHVKTATDYLKKKEDYECQEILGKGTYGSVVKVVNKNKDVRAAKIVENRVVNRLELNEWPKLNHQNVLRLMETIYGAEGVVIFITELMETNLFTMLQEKEFKKDPHAPEKCRIIARQVFSGLAYLHDLKLCHLDLRAENIFVAPDKRVVVADFSGLTFADEYKKFCPLPHSLRPPEMLLVKRVKVSPMPIDLWACGLLLAHLFMGRGYYVPTVKNTKAGHIEAVIQYTECFSNKKYVATFVSQTYPNSNFPESKISDLIALISLFLEMNPKLRITPYQALDHSFLSSPIIEVNERMPATMSGAAASIVPNTEETSTRLPEVRFEVLSRNCDGQHSENSVDHKKRKSKWTKYRPSFQNIRKLYASSPPLFKRKRSKLYQKDASKNNKSLQNISIENVKV